MAKRKPKDQDQTDYQKSREESKGTRFEDLPKEEQSRRIKLIRDRILEHVTAAMDQDSPGTSIQLRPDSVIFVGRAKIPPFDRQVTVMIEDWNEL